MKKILLLLALPLLAQAQKIDKIITRAETERIETYLASNELAGRKPFTPGIEKAAKFISAEFEKAGLKKTKDSYLQTFPMFKSQLISVSGNVNNGNTNPKLNSSAVQYPTDGSLTGSYSLGGAQPVSLAISTSAGTALTPTANSGNFDLAPSARTPSASVGTSATTSAPTGTNYIATL